MKKILIITIIFLLSILSISILIQIKYSPSVVYEPLYKYFIDPDLRQQYNKYKICKTHTSKESCLSQPTCFWYESWFDTIKIEYCVNKDYEDYIKIQNEKNKIESKSINFEL